MNVITLIMWHLSLKMLDTYLHMSLGCPKVEIWPLKMQNTIIFG
ncbi:hypothetical protein AD23_2235 [Escherichia coli 2-005-03_S4_C3]|nr:hypothetical protein AD23_2235 [Escherichia coli 2-005-03_S4_C3]KDT27628.1 hypothetical protein AC67_2256 [Escherichia coli 2-052-05_S4_C1]KDW68407.1 hypothetical protein AC40_0453 [Escherichia coli 2-005-03_S3_C3]